MREGRTPDPGRVVTAPRGPEAVFTLKGTEGRSGGVCRPGQGPETPSPAPAPQRGRRASPERPHRARARGHLPGPRGQMKPVNFPVSNRFHFPPGPPDIVSGSRARGRCSLRPPGIGDERAAARRTEVRAARVCGRALPPGGRARGCTAGGAPRPHLRARSRAGTRGAPRAPLGGTRADELPSESVGAQKLCYKTQMHVQIMVNPDVLCNISTSVIFINIFGRRA